MKVHELFRRHFWIVAINLLSVAAFLHARGVGALIGAGVAPGESLIAGLPAPPRASAPRSTPQATPDLGGAAILARNAFDSITGPLHDRASATVTVPVSDTDAAQIVDPTKAPACEGVRVIAIVASSDPDWSLASFIPGDTASPVMRRRGGELDGRTVRFIGRDRVWLGDDRGLCQASMWGKMAPAPAASIARDTAPRSALLAEVAAGIHPSSATSFNVERRVVEKVMEHQAELVSGMRAVPELAGAVHGLRFSRVKAGSLTALLGLRTGDLIETINGFDISNPEEALAAYARLRLAPHLLITVLRSGAVTNLDYDIAE